MSLNRTTALAALALTAASLACSVLAPVATAPAPPTATLPPPTTAIPAPATDTATAPPPTATLSAAGRLRLVVAAPDLSVGLVDLAGQPHPLAEAPEPLYVLAQLDRDPAAPPHAYSLSAAGVFPLDVVQNIHQGFAAYVGPAAPQGRLAWDTYTIDAAGQGVTSQIHLSSPDGSDARVLLEEAGSDRVLRVWRWAPDGQQLYFSREPLGLGGYILFPGVSNLLAHNLADGITREVVPEAAAGIICLDDLSHDGSLAAHHCQPGQVSVLSLDLGQVAAILPPPEVGEFAQHGDARFSPNQTRLAFAMARGAPEAEQGWVAVSDGLSGGSRLVATAPPGDYFQVKQWLDEETLLLQSWGASPGVWVVQADGTDLRRLADGTLLGLMDGEPGTE